MAGKTITITSNYRQVAKQLAKLGKEGDRMMGEELYREGEEIMTLSKRDYVPVDTSTLKNSGHVELPAKKGGRMVVTLGYGGGAADYAVYVHERIFTISGRLVHHPIGQAKYLEVPTFIKAQRMPHRIASNLHRKLARRAMRSKK